MKDFEYYLDLVCSEYLADYKEDKTLEKYLAIMKKSTLSQVKSILAEAQKKPNGNITLNEQETYVQGDMHGNPRHPLLKLYNAGIIDENGIIKDRNEDLEIIQLGDIIDRNEFSAQSFLLMKVLKKQSEEKKHVKVILVEGNHNLKLIKGEIKGGYLTFWIKQFRRFIKALFINWSKIPVLWQDLTCGYSCLKKMAFHDITKGQTICSYAKGRFLFLHAGLPTNEKFQKDLLLAVLRHTTNEPTMKNYQEKSIEEISNFLESKFPIETILKTISEIFNMQLAADTARAHLCFIDGHHSPLKYDFVKDKKNSPLWNRDLKSKNRSKYKLRGFLAEFLQVVGHNTTQSGAPEIVSAGNSKVIMCDTSKAKADNQMSVALVNTQSEQVRICIPKKEDHIESLANPKNLSPETHISKSTDQETPMQLPPITTSPNFNLPPIKTHPHLTPRENIHTHIRIY